MNLTAGPSPTSRASGTLKDPERKEMGASCSISFCCEVRGRQGAARVEILAGEVESPAKEEPAKHEKVLLSSVTDNPPKPGLVVQDCNSAPCEAEIGEQQVQSLLGRPHLKIKMKTGWETDCLAWARSL